MNIREAAHSLQMKSDTVDRLVVRQSVFPLISKQPLFRFSPAIFCLLLLLAMVAGLSSDARSQSVIPAQFIAKMYTEGLGRAPDQDGWTMYVDFFQQNGCGATQLSTVGQQIYTSAEFLADYSDNEARVVALYRGALSRDPDQAGLTQYVSMLNSGISWATVVNDIFASAEFTDDVPNVCSATTPNYHFGNQTPPALTPGPKGFTGTQAELQSLLNKATAGTTVRLAQKAVITLTSSLTVPQGVTLTTEGAPETTSYALMGRLARASTFDGPNVVINGGGNLTNVWVDGQRNVLGYHKVAGGAGDNANVVTDAGANTVVSNNKLSDPQGGTNFFSSPGDAEHPCSNEIVRGNLVTAYSADHGYTVNSDGLTMECEGLHLERNNIVDVSDIGIVLFATPGVTQHSVISHNTIVSAGLSMNASISADPSTGNAGGSSLDYTGARFTDNTLWTGPYTTFDFGIEAGAREFFLGGSNNSNGHGAAYINNTTGSLSARVRAGIAVAGMLDVTIKNDAQHPTDFVPVSFAGGSPAAACPGGQVISEAAVGNASGNYPAPTFNGNFDGCVIGQLVPSGDLQITPSPLTFDSTTQTFDGTVNIQNVSSNTVNGPFTLLFVELTTGATLVNASGSSGGVPELAIPNATALAPGQSVTVNVEFTNSSSATITYTPAVFAGSFNQ